MYIVYWVHYDKNQNISRVSCPPMLSLNWTTKRYVNRNTFWSFTCALISLIPLCSCCDFNANWKNVFMLIKQIGVHSNLQSCHVYIHTVGITGAGYSHYCSIFSIICDNLNTFVLRISNSNKVHLYCFFFATEFFLPKRNSTLQGTVLFKNRGRMYFYKGNSEKVI